MIKPIIAFLKILIITLLKRLIYGIKMFLIRLAGLNK